MNKKPLKTKIIAVMTSIMTMTVMCLPAAAFAASNGVTKEEIAGEYELETGNVIIREFRERGIDPDRVPGVLVHSHGPFVWGTDANNAVHNAVVMEECAKMVYRSILINPEIGRMQQELLDKHYKRIHGPGAYYGQK